MEYDFNDQRGLVNSEVSEHEISLTKQSKNSKIFNKITNFLTNITLEPCIFLYFLAMSMEGALLGEVMIQKMCLIKFNFSETVCTNLTLHKEEQITVEKASNDYMIYFSIIRSLPCILFVLFLGAWSDKHGRLIPLALPYIGCALSSILLWVNTYFWNADPDFLLISAVPIALTGGRSCLMMSMYSYISDISDIRNRTYRIAVFDTSLMLGTPIGLILSSVSKDYIGFSGTYIVTTLSYSVCIMYIFARIQETRGSNAVHDLEGELRPTSEGCSIKDLFDFNNIKLTFQTTFMKRANYGRAKIIILFLSILCMVLAFNEVPMTKYLYGKLKFGWNYDQFIYWFVASMMFQFVGLCIAFPIMSFKFGMRDEFIGILGALTVIAASIFMAFATSTTQMYIACGVPFLGAIPLPASRSLVSKVVPGDSLGKIFSVLAAFESGLPLAGAPLYALTFNASISFFPGLFLFITATLYAVPIVVFIINFYLSRRDQAALDVREYEANEVVS